MTNSTLTIGIDIGWSEKQRSCAFAAIDPLLKLSWPDRADRYGSADLGCCRFRLSELIEFLVCVRQAMSSYERTAIIVDGPLGPATKPILNREVDSIFRSGDFHGRMQPADINNELGRTYVDATYQVVNNLDSTCRPWVGGPLVSPVLIAETNPTVGLALLNQKYARECLPSRKQPLVPPSTARSERAIRAKSDFYWRVGGNEHCASILGVPAIAKERNHENIAGIYCLAVALSLAVDEAIVCGDQVTGVYVFPNRIDSDWHGNLETAGVTYGEVSDISRCSTAQSFAAWSRATIATKATSFDLKDRPEDPGDADEELAANGDCESLLLNDNGGIWDKHNDWLEGLRGPVDIRCKVSGVKAQLSRAKSMSQWKSDPKPLPIARSHGFKHDHLSSDRSITISVEILKVEL